MMIVVSPDNLSEGGMTLDQIRDKLFAEGYNNLLAFDGSDSATLIEGNDNILVKPAQRKDNTIPTGLKVEEN
jgi:hypothetical protein